MMRAFDKLSRFNKVLVFLTLALLVYGAVCRMARLYFFWESKPIGWVLLLLTVISILAQRIKANKAANKKTLPEKIAIGIVLFVLFIQNILFFVVPQTNAYQAAKQFLLTDSNVEKELGKVNDLFLLPAGAMSVKSGAEGESGQAELHFIVKGSAKFKDISLLLEKELTTGWTIIKTN